MVLGLDRSCIKNARGGRILVYHGICRHDHLRFNTLFLTRQTFERQLKLYKKYFCIVSLDDFYHQRFSKDKFTICLTFDDGFANNYQYVLPLLEQYQVPATFFVTAIRDAGYDILWNDFLCIAGKYGPEHFTFKKEVFYKGTDNRYISSSNGIGLADMMRSSLFEDKAQMIKFFGPLNNKIEKEYWLQMTAEQIKALSASKWATVGSHSYYHNDQAKITTDALKKDLSTSKEYLERITCKEIKALAFPYGSYTREVIKTARDTGFKQLLATEFLFPGDADNDTLRERFTINPFISNINQLYANIRGNYK